MAPLVEIAHIWVIHAPLVLEKVELAIIEEIGDDRADIFGLNTSSDVLTITATIRLPIILLVIELKRMQEGVLTYHVRRHSWKRSSLRCQPG